MMFYCPRCKEYYTEDRVGFHIFNDWYEYFGFTGSKTIEIPYCLVCGKELDYE